MFSSPWALKGEISRLKIHDDEIAHNLTLWVAQATDEQRAINTILDKKPELIKGRLLKVIDFLEQEIDLSDSLSGKVVVFTKYRDTMTHFMKMLDARGLKAVSFSSDMSRDELEDSVYLFQNDPQCKIIVCDETGGEGRNFQNADWIIQLDLPWTANAIEQRIGRLDRLGREESHMVVNTVVITAKDTIDEQIFTIWNQGMHLFEKSLSGLEIITRELNQAISEALLDDFYNGLANALDDIVEMTDDTKDAVEEEQLFDSGAVIYKPLSQAVEQMLSTYQGGEGNVFQSAMLGWSSQAGLVSTRTSEEQLVQFTQERFSPRAAIQSLLIPPDWKFYNTTSIVRHAGKILGTFDRATAIKREDLLFFAPGDPVFDSIIGNAVDNGRGRCCAFVTNGPFNYYGFVCIYNVEPNINKMLESDIPIQLLSQFRMYLPMKQIVVFIPLTEASKSVPEDDLLSLLHDKATIRDATHLGSRKSHGACSNIEAFILHHPESEWKRLAISAEKAARAKASAICKEESDLNTAKREMGRIIHGYESEALYLDKPSEVAAQKRVQYTAAYRALEHPLIHLDSMSLMKVNCKNEIL
jgi:ATP-dependent helicase HepA